MKNQTEHDGDINFNDEISFEPVTRSELRHMSDDEQRNFNKGLADFALELYPQIAGKDNFVCSPYSLACALSILEIGTDGNSCKQIGDVLGTSPFSEEKIKSAFYKEITKYDSGISLSNSIWVSNHMDLQPSYREECMRWFNAFSANVDFTDNRRTAKAINKWCYDSTNGMIPEIVSEKQFDAYTRLLIINTLFFAAKWDVIFKDLNDFTFTGIDGKASLVPAITSTAILKYFENDKFKATSVPFRDGHDMILLLPKTGNFGLAGALSTFNSSNEYRKVSLSMPSFSITSENIGFKTALESLGMKDIFSNSDSDFSRMTSESGLSVTKIYQNARIKVDKEGCEASAATVIDTSASDSGDDGPVIKPAEFKADHPFYFIITGNGHPILFIGQVSKVN